MIYINFENKSEPYVKDFLEWFVHEFPKSSCETPSTMSDNDVLLRNSTLGFLPIIGKQISICWDLYPEMKLKYNTYQWDRIIERINESAMYSTYRIVSSMAYTDFYKKYGTVEIIPIGVDTEIFKPLNNKIKIKEKYGIPLDKKIGVWIGQAHPIFGFNCLIDYIIKNPNVFWILIWDDAICSLSIENCKIFTNIKNDEINELLNAGDFLLSTFQLKSFYIRERQAMASNIPFVIYNKVEREFLPSKNPRNDVFEMGWDTEAVKDRWIRFFEENGVIW